MLLEQYLDPIRLKEGKDKCPCCGKLMRSYCKTLEVATAYKNPTISTEIS